MAKTPKRDQNERNPAETAKVRDATLKRMLAKKPQPHKQTKASKDTK